MKLGSGIKMSFVPDNWRADPLVLGSRRGRLKSLGPRDAQAACDLQKKGTGSTPSLPFPQHPFYILENRGDFLEFSAGMEEAVGRG